MIRTASMHKMITWFTPALWPSAGNSASSAQTCPTWTEGRWSGWHRLLPPDEAVCSLPPTTQTVAESVTMWQQVLPQYVAMWQQVFSMQCWYSRMTMEVWRSKTLHILPTMLVVKVTCTGMICTRGSDSVNSTKFHCFTIYCKHRNFGDFIIIAIIAIIATQRKTL